MRVFGRCGIVGVLICVVVGVYSDVALALEPFGSFVDPRAVGVNQANGDVYVVDTGGTGSIARFDADGVSAVFSAVQPYVAGNALIGIPAGGFALESLFPPQVAIDSSVGGFGSGLVYLTNVAAESVVVFSVTGTFVGEIPSGSASPLSGGAVCGVAVSATGDVYVSHVTGHVDRYAPVDGVPDHDVLVSQFATPFLSCGLAVDSAGSVYVQQWSFAGTGPVLEYPGAVKVDVAGSAVAVNPADDHVFVDQSSRIAQYDPQGGTRGLPTLGSGILASSTGIGVAGATGRVYAADSSGVVDVFQTAVPDTPVISNEAALRVTSTSAEVRAAVNPKLAPTKYAVEYGTDISYSGGTAPTGTGVDIGAGEEPQQIRVALGALSPGTTYHYRVFASNRFGVTNGPDRTLTTYRAGLATLPDNRAWELVSPLDKNGGEIRGITDSANIGGVAQATPDGSGITFTSVASFQNPVGAQTRNQYIARRQSGEWTSENITAPSISSTYSVLGGGGPYKIFSEDLSRSVMLNGNTLPVANPPLPDSGAPVGYQNFYVRDSQTGRFDAVMKNLPRAAGEEVLSPVDADMEAIGGSPDLAHVVIRASGALTSGAVYDGKQNLYEWSAGNLDAINILPGVTNGETTPGIVTLGAASEGAAISTDGLRVFWTLGFGGSGQRLFVRDGVSTPQAETIQIDSSHGPGKSGRGEYRTASGDGSRVFFTDREQLTNDSTAGGFGTREDLYEFNVDTKTLVDLTVDHNLIDEAGEGASVQGVLGTNTDGSYVYFVAGGALPQAHPNHDGLGPKSDVGAKNLYVSHDGDLTFITTLGGGAVDELTWRRPLSFRTARVTPDGRHVVFNSTVDLTSYESEGMQEVYEYDAVRELLSCVSCNPSGATPIGGSSIPPGTPNGNDKALYQSRVVSENGGRVFFESRDALVPQDTNHHQDVYEYEDGAPHLVSGGTGDSDAEFVDASKDGNDVFFITGQRLVGQDEDELVDLYDARVNGGIPPLPSPIPCTGSGCQGVPPPPPIFATPSTITFAGLGNYSPPSNKPARKKAKKKVVKRKKAKHRASKHKPAHTTMGGRGVDAGGGRHS